MSQSALERAIKAVKQLLLHLGTSWDSVCDRGEPHVFFVMAPWLQGTEEYLFPTHRHETSLCKMAKAISE